VLVEMIDWLISRVSFRQVEKWVLLAVVMLAPLVVVSFWPQYHHSKPSRVNVMTNHAQDIYSGLVDFQRAYGGLPNHGTAQKMGSEVSDLVSSNDYFRLLFESGLWEEEKVFGYQLNPDNEIDGTNALLPGENEWAYCDGGDIADRMRPIMIWPLKSQANRVIADRSHSGKAVVLFGSGKVEVYEIGLRGEIVTEKGNLLSSNHPAWLGAGYHIVLPE